MSKSAHALHDHAVQQQSDDEVSYHEAELHAVEEEPTVLDLVVVGVVFTTVMTAPVWISVLMVRGLLKRAGVLAR